MKITKWAIESKSTNDQRIFVSKHIRRHGHDVVSLDDEDILFLQTREIARNYKKSFEDPALKVKKVTLEVV